ncbi:MAG: RNA-binding domain-containing protein [Litorilinea sp.]
MSRKRKPNTSRAPQAEAPAAPSKTGQRRWYKVDLHLHTPASRDYEEPQVSYLDWMRTVVSRGLEIVAVTDHNTVAGIGAIRREMEWLTKLEGTNRLTEAERQRLAEWRELANQVLVLPGFEFTATFGFHILGIFPPETSVRQMEHVLLSLSIPEEKLDEGSTETGASTDVLTAYKTIHEAGGLVIAAHANSTHGVAMRNFPFGGQTKIAYTQDVHLDALEVTDLDRGNRSTARFFNGSKSEYPRRMHCFHGSDAHRLTLDPKNPKRLGIGERASEFLLDEPSFDNIRTLLRSKQFDRTRPARPDEKPFDAVASAREEGPSIVQSFHDSASQRGGKLTAILNDICAFANTAGGSVFVGIGASARRGKPRGVDQPAAVEQEIRSALQERFAPQLDSRFDVLQTEGAKILRIQVPKGTDRPYCLDDYKYYVRNEAETSQAVRDELIALILESADGGRSRSGRDNGNSSGGSSSGGSSSGSGSSSSSGGNRQGQRSDSRDHRRGGRGRSASQAAAGAESSNNAEANLSDAGNNGAGPGTDSSSGVGIDNNGASVDDTFYLPQVGVEIVETETRNGNRFHTIRDLRNNHIIKNVTRKGARKLWNYAIQQHEDAQPQPEQIEWQADIGLLNAEKRAGRTRYDLVMREGDTLRVFYGVTEDGMEGRWSVFLNDD